MSLYDGIQRFLEDVDPTILARGRDYYRRGCVEHVDLEGCFATAEVSGSELYQVEIDFDDDGEVEFWDCDCPYSWGPVCKHIVAVLLALQKIPQPKCSPAAEKINISKWVEQADKEQLAALVLEHCREDKRFQSRVLSELDDSGEQELTSIKEVIREAIRSNTHHGYIDESGFDNICTDLYTALEQAESRNKRGQYGCALEIAQYILLTGLGLMESDDGALSGALYAALDTLENTARALAESGNDRGEWVQALLSTAQDRVFDDWEDYRFDFLERITVLADAQNEDAFKSVLRNLSNIRWESFKDDSRYMEQDRFIRYRLECVVHGPEAGRAFLEKSIGLDMFRLMLVREYMDEENYADAERLCQERLEQGISGQWQYLLYEIYQNWGQREKQIGQARKLALLGDKKFYQTTKELLTQDGRWQDERPKLLAELKAQRPAREYMEILAQENETEQLMELVMVYRDMVFQYGGLLARQYGTEIYGMCSAVIRQFAKRLNDRKDYHRLCGLLGSLVDFGGVSEARVLIQELQQMYPRRPALWDELEQVEQRMKETVQNG